jgi:hypothetical protein
MMRNTQKYLAALFFILLSSSYITPVFAAESEPLLESRNFSIGAGISTNSVSGPASDETGFQIFGAYDLNQVNLAEGVNSSIEFGLMDYGFSGNSTGIWATYVIDGPISGRFGWVGRLGLDVGDDSGLMLGAGLGWSVNSKIDLRGEYVIRDDIDSLQFNFLYHL